MLASSAISLAQDKIYKKDGSIINARVTDVNDVNIRYFLSDSNADKEGYLISKSKVFKIIYASGHEEFIRSNNSFSPNAQGKFMTYREMKNRYSTKNYVAGANDKYNVALMGICSAFIPGLGQLIEGEILKGILFLTSPITIFILSVPLTILTLGFGSVLIIPISIGVYIYGIVNAINIAKIKNQYYRDIEQQSLSFIPNMIDTHNIPTNNILRDLNTNFGPKISFNF